MDSERWKQVDSLLQSVLDRPFEEREAFLRQACAGDETLEREVRSLLSSHKEAGSFLESPAMKVAAKALADNPSHLALDKNSMISGATVSHYQILEKLGAGGMGEVYRARDTKLGRKVALKILPPQFSDDPERLARFQREAQVLASLSHPNIAAIYGLEESGGPSTPLGTFEVRALVMELVEGPTLAERIAVGAGLVPARGTPLPLDESLHIAKQIAGALEAAHDQGIIHRDLKPANIKVRLDGTVKVLDFGLAKLAPNLGTIHESPFPESATVTATSRAGAIVGTAAYMSPEQARGQAVDRRADIWAFGCVLFEMLTAQRAFPGETFSDTLAAVLKTEPDWSVLPGTAPEPIQRLVRRCLTKDPKQRLRDIGEARIAIEETLSSADSAASISDRGESPDGVPNSQVQRALPWTRPTRPVVWLIPVAAVLVITSVLIGRYYHRASGSGLPTSNFFPVTSFPDSATSPAVSPDGRILAFIRGSAAFFGKGQIYVKLLPDGEPVQLTHDDSNKISPSVSPDGSRIAYGTVGASWDTWIVPTFGGEPRLMLADASGLTWIDAHHVLFSEIKKAMHMGVVTSTESRNEERDVYVPSREAGMAHRSYLAPDHQWALVAEMDSAKWLPCRLVKFDGSESRRVGPQNATCTSAAWSPDGNWMYFSERFENSSHIWRQRFPDGEPEPVTSGPNQEEGIAMMPDGKSFITSSGTVVSALYVHDSRGDHAISDAAFTYAPSFSSDDKKLYYLVAANGAAEGGELWVTDRTNNHSEPVLPGMSLSAYSISAEGKLGAVSAMGADHKSHIWLISLDRRFPPQQLTFGSREDFPQYGDDGHIYYRQSEGNYNYVYRINANSTEKTRVSSVPIYGLFEVKALDAESAMAVVETGNPDENNPYRLAALPLDGGSKSLPIIRWLSRAGWNAAGTEFFIQNHTMPGTGETTVVFHVKKGKLPDIPPGGFRNFTEVMNRKGGEILERFAAFGLDTSTYAYEDRSVHRNLYRVTLP